MTENEEIAKYAEKLGNVPITEELLAEQVKKAREQGRKEGIEQATRKMDIWLDDHQKEFLEQPNGYYVHLHRVKEAITAARLLGANIGSIREVFEEAKLVKGGTTIGKKYTGR